MATTSNSSTTQAYPSDLTCLPRWGTPRNPNRKTIGPRVGEIAQRLGKPMMPWQQYEADVAGEVNPDSGLLAYRDVGTTVPRQSGKTTLLMSEMTHRCNGFGPRQNIIYTAQTRTAARKKWEDEHLEILKRSVFKKLFRPRLTNGMEAMIWRNGSHWGIEANTESAGHGNTLDMGVIDEAFKQTDFRLEQAMKPAMITRPQPQLWWLSTAGTPDSTYLLAKLEAGRAAADAQLEAFLAGRDITSSIAYFEWSAADGADPGDPATWWSCMPALGITVTEDTIRSEYETWLLAEFERAYLNRWNPLKRDSLIPAEHWQHRDVLVPIEQFGFAGPLFYSVEINDERTAGAIAVSDGRAIECVYHRPGADWLLAETKKILALNGNRPIVIDPSSPAASLIPEFRTAGISIIEITGAQRAQAWGQLYDAAIDHTLLHLAQPELDLAVAGAVKRVTGDIWTVSRTKSTTDVIPLVACAWAHWAARSTDPANTPGVGGDFDPDEVAKVVAQLEEEERRAIKALDPV